MECPFLREWEDAVAECCFAQDFFLLLWLVESKMQHADPHISLRITGLQDGEHPYSFRVDARDLDLPSAFQGEVAVELVLEKTRSQFFVKGQIQASVSSPCDRCWEAVSFPVCESLLVVFSMVPVRSSDPDPDENEIRHLDPSSHLIDVTTDVRDALILALPMRIICGEDEEGNPTCAHPPEGLDTSASSDSDPRWSGLTTLSHEDK